MDREKTSLAIIIVSYNVRDYLSRCLESVLADVERLSYVQAQVWVVDNASDDDSAAMVREQFPQVTLVECRKNHGFARGNNVALRALGFSKHRQTEQGLPDVVLLLNPDTEVQTGALDTLLRFIDAEPAAGTVVPGLEYGDGRFQHSAFKLPGLAQLWFEFFPRPGRLVESPVNGRYPRALYDAGQPFPIECGLGAALMLRREAIQQVGLLDEDFFMYCEEIDWCWRLRREGWRLFCVPAARIVHHEGQSARQFREKMFVTLWRSRFRLYRKHRSRLFRLVAHALVHLGLKTEEQRARQAARRRELDASTLARRLAAYREVALL